MNCGVSDSIECYSIISSFYRDCMLINYANWAFIVVVFKRGDWSHVLLQRCVLYINNLNLDFRIKPVGIISYDLLIKFILWNGLNLGAGGGGGGGGGCCY